MIETKDKEDLFVCALNISEKTHKKLVTWFASREGN